MNVIEKIRAEIERLIEKYEACKVRNATDENFKTARLIGYRDILHILDTLQEQEVEWNEEDEKNFRDIDSIIFLDNDLSAETEIRLRAWLKSLHYQHKQEDRYAEGYRQGKLEGETLGYQKGYDKAMEECNRHTSYHISPLPCYERGPCTNPHMDCINCPRRESGFTYTVSPNTVTTAGTNWKPSEDQISALNYFIKLWGNSDDQLEYTKIFNTVKSLHNELKKLM